MIVMRVDPWPGLTEHAQQRFDVRFIGQHVAAVPAENNIEMQLDLLQYFLHLFVLFKQSNTE